MSVRAKFKVNKIELTESSRYKKNADGTDFKDDKGKQVIEPCKLTSIGMSPVYSPDPTSENHKFWTSSPSGSLTLGCVNEEAAVKFELGKEYYLDFTLAN